MSRSESRVFAAMSIRHCSESAVVRSSVTVLFAMPSLFFSLSVSLCLGFDERTNCKGNKRRFAC